MTDARARVCVVDDDPGIRESLRFLFEDVGYDVVEAEDGIAAIALLRADPRAYVVLLDRMMPRLDGVGALQRLQQEPPEVSRRIVVLFMTARNDPPDVHSQELIRSATFATIPKPFDLDALVATVEKAWQSLASQPGQTTAG